MPKSKLRTVPFTNVDAAWLRMEDSTDLMMITSLAMFDEPIALARLKALIEERFLCYDRFRMRVVDPKRPGAMPYWEEDPNFDLNAHVHRVALPAPGDQAALQDMVSDLMSTPLDFSKPLWHWHLIENYNGGCALLSRIHHSIGDGVSLVHVQLNMCDESPEATAQADLPESRRRRRPIPLIGPAAAAVDNTLRLTGTLMNEGIETLVHPMRRAGQVWDTTKLGLSMAATLAKLTLYSPDPMTVLKGKLGVSKRAAWSAPISLQDVKAVGQAMGGTINDVLLTAVAGALRRYLQSRGDPVEGINIRAMVPVDLRPRGEVELGNRFGLVFLSLPLGIEDPIDRLLELKRRMDALKRSPEAMVAMVVLNAMGVVPEEIHHLLLEFFSTKATGVMTNVPGPRKTLYMAGKPIRRQMFWVPQSGRLGLGVSIYSYAGEVMLGVATDAGLVPDPETIISGFHDEFHDLMQMVRPADASPSIKTPQSTAISSNSKQGMRIPKPAAVSGNGAESKAEAQATGARRKKPVAVSVLAGSAELPESKPAQCAGLTRSGSQCRNPALAGSVYCRRHQQG